ncbi:Ger(x)C family spore germination protein [Solibacillus sp. FSL W8-0474]|uniref:Ger(x)C family spore germination protein n=1 Tax=Solibacillus sp. FSL W8-0474 TaxID=2975336 RepID=UPI0030FAF74F
MKKFLLFPLLLLLSGCWDTNQAERMYYIHGLGIDYKDEQYEIYAQIVAFTNIAKSEQPNPDATQAEVGVATGRTFDEAFFNLYQTMDERVFLGHLKYVIFSENIAKENKVEPIINSFIRYRELRYTTWAYMTNSPLDEVLLITPIINKSITLSKLSDPLSSYSQSSRIRPIQFRELMIQLNEPSYEAKIPLVDISENWSKEDGPDPVYTFKGISILHRDSGFKGNLLGDDLNGVQWLIDQTKRSDVTIKMEESEERYTTSTVDEVHTEIIPVVTEKKVQFDINVKLVVQTNEILNQQKMDVLKKEIARQVKKEIEQTYEASLEFDADIYRLSEVLYRKNVKAWKEYEKDGKIPLDESTIRNLDVELVKVKGERITSD